jgi:hypothetical protein
MLRTTRSYESRIAAVVLLASVTGCASSKPTRPTHSVSVQDESHAWIGRSADWMSENYKGVLRDWTLPGGGEEWLYENPRRKPSRDPATARRFNDLAGCATRNFFEPEHPTHLVCFDADRLVTRVIRRGEPGWRVLPLPEPAN